MQKIFLLLLIVILSVKAKATNYYISNAGNDGNAGTIGAPWQTIAKVNTVWLAGTFAPGDSILFARGQTFYGRINAKESGGSGSPIVISGYGTGAKPVITSFVTLNSWTNLGNGLYEIVNSAFGSTCNVVTVNGKSYAMGRYPNWNAPDRGWLRFEFHTGSTTITDNQLTGVPDWTGADIVVRTNRYIIDRRTITDHANSSITFSPGTFYNPINGFGYFIENDVNTLDQFGEWYYRPGTQSITMFFGAASPASYTIKATTIDTLIDIRTVDNITVNGIAFEGANERAINVRTNNTGSTKILNCDIKYCGENAIFISTSSNILIDGNTIEDADVHGIWISGGDHYTITNNNFKRIAIFQGHAGAANMNTAIRCNADDNLIQYNVVDSVGWHGIRYAGNRNQVLNNFVQHYNMIIDDGAGIYTFGSSTGSKIIGNICINGVGAIEGTTSVQGATSGFYLDDNSSGVIVDSNSSANNNLNGIFFHNANNVFLRDNTFYNGTLQQFLLVHNNPQGNFRNLFMSRNIFFAKTATQMSMKAQTDSSDIDFSLWATSDSNYFARPLAQTTIIRAVRPLFQQNMTIPDWYSFSGMEQHSYVSPKTYLSTINPDDSIRFEYNASKSNKTVLLPGTYVDVKGNIYTNSVVLTPFTSKILMSTAYVDTIVTPPVGTPPVVSITGPPDGSTYLSPADISLTVSAADSIAEVRWYANGTLLSTETTDPYTFVWVGVPAGSYSITAVATDVNGLSTTSAAINITVTNPVIPPGTDIHIRINKILIVQ